MILNYILQFFLDKIFVTDNAANIVSAITNHPDWERIACFNHTLQLAIKDVEDTDVEWNSLFEKCGKFVGLFNHSVELTRRFKEIQTEPYPNLTPLSLLQYNHTRWNSRYVKTNFSIKSCHKHYLP